MGMLMLGAIGVVFGDIGTSPLYTLRECFTGSRRLELTPENVLGVPMRIQDKPTGVLEALNKRGGTFDESDADLLADERSIAESFEEAVQQGQQAGLAEQSMEGLYSVSLANVQPGETVHAIFSYHERIKFDDGHYEFVFPMGLTPKYHSPAHPAEGDGVDAPLAEPGERIGDVSIEVNLHPGLPYGEPTSPSHHLALEDTREGGLRIFLASPCLPDHDFVLRLPVATSENRLSAWRASGQDGDYFLAILQPRIELSILIILAGLWAILKGKWWVLAAVSFLYSYSYSAPVLLPVVALIVFVILNDIVKRLPNGWSSLVPF